MYTVNLSRSKNSVTMNTRFFNAHRKANSPHWKNQTFFKGQWEEFKWHPRLWLLLITYSCIKIDTNHNVDMFQTMDYRRKTLINFKFKNNSGASTWQVQSRSSVSKSISSQWCRIPQLWENLQFNNTDLVSMV